MHMCVSSTIVEEKKYLTFITSSTLPVSQWYPSLSLEKGFNPDKFGGGKIEHLEVNKRDHDQLFQQILPAATITTKIIAREWLEICRLISVMISIKSSKCTRPGTFYAEIPTALTFNFYTLLINYNRLQ